MKNWTPCIIASIVCKLLGLAAVLGLVDCDHPDTFGVGYGVVFTPLFA